MPLDAMFVPDRPSMRLRELWLDDTRRAIHKALTRHRPFQVESGTIAEYARTSQSVIAEKLYPAIPAGAMKAHGRAKHVRPDYQGAHEAARRFVAVAELVAPRKQLRKGLSGYTSGKDAGATDTPLGCLIDYLAEPVGGDGIIRANANQLNRLLKAIAPAPELRTAFTPPRLTTFHDSIGQGVDLAPDLWSGVMTDFHDVVNENKAWRVALQQQIVSRARTMRPA